MAEKSGVRPRVRIIVPCYPAFNIYSHIAHKTTALGPVCLASAAREAGGWDVEVIDENNLRRHGPKGDPLGADHAVLQRQRPAKVVGLYGGLTSTIPRLYEIAAFYKHRGAIVVAGGQHFVDETIPEALRSGIDYVVLGEGEETIKDLLKVAEGTMDPGTVKGIAFLRGGHVVRTPCRPPITDFDALPLPDFSLVRYAKIDLYPVGRIRGCGMDCEFCTVKGKPRPATPERLLEQISVLVETRDAREFFVVDDLFGQQREETIRFCGMLKEYQRRLGKRLGLTVQIRLDKATDPGLLSAMRQAGIDTVAIGFESPVEEELKAMHKHLMPADMLAMTKEFHKFGFLVHGMFIFGYPAEKGVAFRMSADERMVRFKRFIRKAKIDTIQILLPTPLPGTELRARLAAQNRIYPVNDVGWEYYDGNFPLFEPDPPMTAEEMQRAIRQIMGKFYQFKYMFVVGLHIFSFPAMVFFLYNIRTGWGRWYRAWRNTLIRFGGWIIMRRWASEFKKDTFMDRLQQAKSHLRNPHQ
jgi:radical SAM superfamily enzyme YgiQ (UPF0313 family)